MKELTDLSIKSNGIKNLFVIWMLIILFVAILFFATYLTFTEIIFQAWNPGTIYIAGILWMALAVDILGMKTQGMSFWRNYC